MQDLVAATHEQLAYELACSMVEPIPGQPGEAAWRTITATVSGCLDALRHMLDRHTDAAAALADVGLRVREAERRWREARRWEIAQMHSDPEPLRRRAA